MIVEYVSKEFWIYHPQSQSGRRVSGKYNHRQGKTDLSSEDWQNDDQAAQYVKWQWYLDKADICQNREDLEEMETTLKQAANIDCGKAMVRLGCYQKRCRAGRL